MAKKQITNKSKSKKVKLMVPKVRESEQAACDQEVEEHCDQEVKEHCDQDGQAPVNLKLKSNSLNKKQQLILILQKEGWELHESYIGHLERTMIPIDIDSWPNMDQELKDKLWLDIKGTFKVAPESEAMVLKSAGEKWRQCKTDLTTKHVMPYAEKKKKLKRPPKNYRFVGQEAWTRFIAQRTCDKWLKLRTLESERVCNRKYHHNLSRKGYIGLQEDEIKKGKLKPEEKPDRAIFWNKARKSKLDDEELDEDKEAVFARIKEKGEFIPSGTDDVLTTALGTPEHSGRVRGVGGFVTPKMFFNLPKERKPAITKAELLAHDRVLREELERTRREMVELKSLFTGSNQQSPNFSDIASCQPVEGEPKAKEILVNDDCLAYDQPPPSEKKGPQICELSVDSIENKVAFGTIFEDDKMNVSVHRVPLKLGHARVLVDGHIQPDVLVPVPIPGGIEHVREAVGSHLAWPRNLISLWIVVKRDVSQSKNKGEVHKIQQEFTHVKVSKKVPRQYKVLYKHATTFIKASGESIPIPCDSDVFGVEKTLYILHENLKALLEFDMIGQAAIFAYMAYLHSTIKRVRKNDDVVLYGFFDPGANFNLNADFQRNVGSRLKEGNQNHIFFLPHNHQTIKQVNSQTGRGNKAPKIKNLVGSPKQPGGVECGYVVIRYMKEIIEDREISFTSKVRTFIFV
ncbi:hypothetical protein AgCh_004988 [Apium graveolens]